MATSNTTPEMQGPENIGAGVNEAPEAAQAKPTNLKQHWERIVSNAPDLTDEQRKRFVELAVMGGVGTEVFKEPKPSADPTIDPVKAQLEQQQQMLEMMRAQSELQQAIESGVIPPEAGRESSTQLARKLNMSPAQQTAMNRLLEQSRAEGIPSNPIIAAWESMYGFGSKPTGETKGGSEVIKREIDYTGSLKVSCVEYLAEEIMRNEDLPDFQEGGPYELLKAVKNPDGTKKMRKVLNERNEEKEEEVKEFQPQNFLRWVRYWMMYHHNESPDEEHNFGNVVALKRDVNSISLMQMLNNPGRHFRSKNYKDENNQYIVYEGLTEQIKKEIWLFSSSRSFDIKYKLLMGDEAKLPGQTIQDFYLNTFTKTVWDDRSSLYHVLSMPEEFVDEKFHAKIKQAKENNVVFENDVQVPEKKEEDHKLGRAINLAYLVYYNISDTKMLEKILGSDTDLLNSKKILEKIHKMAETEVPPDQRDQFLDPKLIKDLEAGKVADFINIFNASDKPNRAIRVVRALIQEELEKKCGITALSDKSYADTFAFSMARWTGGAARNDTEAVGFDAWTRIQNTDGYRKKLLNYSRGGAFGNPYTLQVIKQVGRDFMTSTYVERMVDFGEKNKVPTHKMLLEVMEEMEQTITDEEYKTAASQLVFPENTMRNFAADHNNRAFTIYGQMIKGEEIKLDKYTEWDIERGVTFDRPAFEEALKEKFFKPMRYAYSTYGQVNFAKMVRARMPKEDEHGKIMKDEKGIKKEYKDVHLAEAMFGREILDIPEFRLKGKEGISINSKLDKWQEKIDWDWIASKEGKVALWRRVALTRIAAELYAHRDKYSTDPRYGIMYYSKVVEALKSIPSDVLDDNYNMKNSKAVGSFFMEEEIKWLERQAGIEGWRIVGGKAGKDVALGVLKGGAKAAAQALGSVAKIA